MPGSTKSCQALRNEMSALAPKRRALLGVYDSWDDADDTYGDGEATIHVEGTWYGDERTEEEHLRIDLDNGQCLLLWLLPEEPAPELGRLVFVAGSDDAS